jgi:hypothetical protein
MCLKLVYKHFLKSFRKAPGKLKHRPVSETMSAYRIIYVLFNIKAISNPLFILPVRVKLILKVTFKQLL